MQEKTARLVVWLLLLLASPCFAEARHAGSRVLTNGTMVVEVMEPNHPERYNRGSRFSPVAAVLSARLDGREFFFNPVEHDPIGDHAGLASEFDLCIPDGPIENLPPGYNEAEVGNGFLKIGVGVLRKQTRQYSLFQNCEVIEPATTSVSWTSCGARFVQKCGGVNGYAYDLEADLIVGTNSISVNWTLRNTGEKPLTTRNYVHNFFRFEDQDVGPGYALSFPYDFTASGLLKEQAQEGRGILFNALIPQWVNAVVPYPAGFDGPNTCELKSTFSGMSVVCTTSLPGLRTDIHARPTYIAPEQFIEIALAPGAHRSWTRTYTFQAKAKHMNAITPMSPIIRDLNPLGIGAYPLEGEIQRILARPAPADWRPSGLTRDAYLDLMEPMVRTASTWVSDEGALIDPVIHKEWAQSTPRFVSSAAVLLHFGRIADLRETVFKAMTYCCSRLSAPDVPKTASADFWMRELVTAYDCLAPLAPDARVSAWQKDLAAVQPEKAYVFVDPSHTNLKSFHNWAVYSSAGESMRDAAGIGGSDDFLWGNRFFETYMTAQTHRFTAYGMYRDPDDPITYDITTRLQFAAAIARGYNGPLRNALEEILRRGDQTMLLFVSPEGFVPFGGRSSQFNFQEAITCVLSELEAHRHREADPALAGAFKRQARLAASAVRPWFADSIPARHIKNRFAPETRHGCDTYGQYSVYSMLATSYFGLAALYADDTIAEHPTPAEIGGYALTLQPAFHKVFLCAEGTYVEIDTQADPNHDATGIGRILFKGLPPGFPLGMPFSDHPKCVYAEGFSAPEKPVALGPVWQGLDGAPDSLASWSNDVLVETKTIETNGIVSGVTCVYRKGETTVQETVRVVRDKVLMDWTVEIAGTPVKNLELTLPCLLTDGESQTALVPTGDGVDLTFRRQTVAFRWDAGMQEQADDAVIANRHGVYRVLRIVAESGRLHLNIRAVR